MAIADVSSEPLARLIDLTGRVAVVTAGWPKRAPP
jgi:phosphoserine aminotransferase